MLDDLRKIHERDPQDALGVAEKQANQLELSFSIAPDEGDIKHVVISGMGGSALSGLIAQVWPNVHVPLTVQRDYDLPLYVGLNTLVIASSYSGNTEETIAAVKDAIDKKAQIVVIASGGILKDIARQHGFPFLELPTGYQPRHAVFASFKALVSILDAYGLTSGKANELQSQALSVREYTSHLLPTVATARNFAKQLALEAMGKSVVIYAGPKLACVAYKWKIDCNENAKNVAWWNTYSELNHNEMIGWTKQPEDKPYTLFELRSNFEHVQIQKRFVVTERLSSGLRPAPVVITTEGESLLAQLLNTIVLGDFMSIYLAFLNGVNPMPVTLLEKLKGELPNSFSGNVAHSKSTA